MKDYQIKFERDMEVCRWVRLVTISLFAGCIFYTLIALPIWANLCVRHHKFIFEIDGWMIIAGLVCEVILVNSAIREVKRGSHKQRRIGKERYEREKALCKERRMA